MLLARRCAALAALRPLAATVALSIPASSLASSPPPIAALSPARCFFSGPTTTFLDAAASKVSSASASSAPPGGNTALDVAMKANKLKRMHQAGQGQGKKEIEMMAWQELNTLTEAQIAMAEGKAVALLLNAWAYFARFWETGKDGPLVAAPQQSGGGGDQPESS